MLLSTDPDFKTSFKDLPSLELVDKLFDLSDSKSLDNTLSTFSSDAKFDDNSSFIGTLNVSSNTL